MKTTCRWKALGALGLGLALGTLTGCQTNVAGMTLPSGHYLEHQPQYIPPSPPFPLPRELSQMQGAAGAPAGAALLPGAPPLAPAAPPPVGIGQAPPGPVP